MNAFLATLLVCLAAPGLGSYFGGVPAFYNGYHHSVPLYHPHVPAPAPLYYHAPQPQPFLPAQPTQHYYQTGSGESEVKTTITAKSNEEYRGFAYHTDYSDGAVSNVVFFQGPNAGTLMQRALTTFGLPPSPLTKAINVTGVETPSITEEARTVASSLVDPIPTTEAAEASNKEETVTTATPQQADVSPTLPPVLQQFYTRYNQAPPTPVITHLRSQLAATVPQVHHTFYSAPQVVPALSPLHFPLQPALTVPTVRYLQGFPVVRGFLLKHEDNTNTNADATANMNEKAATNDDSDSVSIEAASSRSSEDGDEPQESMLSRTVLSPNAIMLDSRSGNPEDSKPLMTEAIIPTTSTESAPVEPSTTTTTTTTTEEPTTEAPASPTTEQQVSTTQATSSEVPTTEAVVVENSPSSTETSSASSEMDSTTEFVVRVAEMSSEVSDSATDSSTTESSP